MEPKGFILKACALSLFGLFSLQTHAAGTTGLDFAGGCPESNQGVTSLCDMGSNADEENVAAILGVDISLVTQITSGYSVTGIGNLEGTWTVTDTSITHLAFKSDGYFILGERNSGVLTGSWDNVIDDFNDWDLTLVMCPDTICTGGPRAYTINDFKNNGGNFAELSNVRAFSVVPVPAAVWLFGTGLLGLVGVARRRLG